MPIWVIILSASIGALVSSIFSLITVILNNKSKRKQELLNHAVKLANDRTGMIIQIAKETHRPAEIHDTIFLVEEYYKELGNIYEKGSLSQSFKEKPNQKSKSK